MIHRIQTIFIALSAVLLLAVVAVPASASADVFDNTRSACQKAGNKPAACVDSDGANPLTGNNGLIIKIANIISIIAGIAAVIIIIVAGLRFVTAGGDAGRVSGARTAIIYALIGLAIIASARFIIGLVTSRL